MANRVTRKRIKVLTNGPIRAKGWVYGPILNPYFESTKIIFSMLKDKIKVVEVLNNGDELVLNTQNFDKDNNIGLGGGDDFVDVVIPVRNNAEPVNVATRALEVAPEVHVTEEPTVISQEVVEEVAPIELPKEAPKKKNKHR